MLQTEASFPLKRVQGFDKTLASEKNHFFLAGRHTKINLDNGGQRRLQASNRNKIDASHHWL